MHAFIVLTAVVAAASAGNIGLGLGQGALIGAPLLSAVPIVAKSTVLSGSIQAAPLLASPIGIGNGIGLGGVGLGGPVGAPLVSAGPIVSKSTVLSGSIQAAPIAAPIGLVAPLAKVAVAAPVIASAPVGLGWGKGW